MAEQLAPLVPRDHVEAKFIARELGVHPASVYRWIAQGKLRAVRIGTRYRVSLSSARALIEQFGLARPAG